MFSSQRASDSFNEKYDLYGKMLYRICIVYLKNPSNVDDAIQDAFINLLYKAPKFKTPEDEQRWLARVAINICKNQLKSSWHKNTVSIDMVDEISTLPETNEIFQIVQKLPDKYKTVIFLHYTEDFSIEDISKILGIGKSAVKMRLMRGRELLRKELEEE